ncbi:MAG: hypothetical protein ABI857_02515 [Acidobacteriota bacterium]
MNGGKGVGVGGVPLHIVRSSSTPLVGGYAATVGGSNVGNVASPVIIATVPVAEMNIALAFWEFTVAAVHVLLQKYRRGTEEVGIEDGSQSLRRKALPRSSNLIVTGRVTPLPIIVTLELFAKFTTRVSMGSSRRPF